MGIFQPFPFATESVSFVKECFDFVCFLINLLHSLTPFLLLGSFISHIWPHKLMLLGWLQALILSCMCILIYIYTYIHLLHVYLLLSIHHWQKKIIKTTLSLAPILQWHDQKGAIQHSWLWHHSTSGSPWFGSEKSPVHVHVFEQHICCWSEWEYENQKLQFPTTCSNSRCCRNSKHFKASLNIQWIIIDGPKGRECVYNIFFQLMKRLDWTPSDIASNITIPVSHFTVAQILSVGWETTHAWEIWSKQWNKMAIQDIRLWCLYHISHNQKWNTSSQIMSDFVRIYTLYKCTKNYTLANLHLAYMYLTPKCLTLAFSSHLPLHPSSSTFWTPLCQATSLRDQSDQYELVLVPHGDCGSWWL